MKFDGGKENPMMKRVLAVAVASVVSMLVTVTCFARPRMLRVDVPFAFEAGNKALPAGQYEIEYMPTGSGIVLRIQQVNGNERLLVSTAYRVSRDPKSHAQMVFHRYGEDYFLAEICNGNGSGLQLSESKLEKEARSSEARIVVALALQ
jgi:hypothetical protein